MLAKLRLVLSITIFFLSFYGSAQSKYWQEEISAKEISSPSLTKSDVKKVKVFDLDQASLYKELATVSALKKAPGIVYFPDVKGKLKAFRVSENSVFAPVVLDEETA